MVNVPGFAVISADPVVVCSSGTVGVPGLLGSSTDPYTRMYRSGTTGTTGLAGGDHLHFGMMVHGVFVNPFEWWDRSWIKNNISSKIAQVGGG